MIFKYNENNEKIIKQIFKKTNTNIKSEVILNQNLISRVENTNINSGFEEINFKNNTIKSIKSYNKEITNVYFSEITCGKEFKLSCINTFYDQNVPYSKSNNKVVTTSNFTPNFNNDFLCDSILIQLNYEVYIKNITCKEYGTQYKSQDTKTLDLLNNIYKLYQELQTKVNIKDYFNIVKNILKLESELNVIITKNTILIDEISPEYQYKKYLRRK